MFILPARSVFPDISLLYVYKAWFSLRPYVYISTHKISPSKACITQIQLTKSDIILKPAFMMKASSLRLNLAFDLVFPLMTPIIHILPIQLNQDNGRTKDKLMSRKLKKKSISSLKFLNLKFFSRLNRFIFLIYLRFGCPHWF